MELLYFTLLLIFINGVRPEDMKDGVHEVEEESDKIPELTGEYYNYTVDEGQMFTLKCRYDDMGSDAQVLWRWQDKYLTLGKYLLNNLNGRAQLDENVITIKNVNRNDTGDYTCSFGIQKQNLQQVHSLKVRYPASIVKIMPSKEVTSYVGFDLTLTCEADGYPEPHVHWEYKNHRHIPHGHVMKNQLHLRNLKHNNAGEYKCVAKNELGEAAEQIVHLRVLDAHYSPNDSEVHAVVNQNITLSCRVHHRHHHERTPAGEDSNDSHHRHEHVPAVKWHLNDSEINVTDDVIVLQNVQLDDAGVYKCKIGSSSRPFRLNVYSYEKEMPKKEADTEEPKTEDSEPEKAVGEQSAASSNVHQTARIVSLLAIFSLVTLFW